MHEIRIIHLVRQEKFVNTIISFYEQCENLDNYFLIFKDSNFFKFTETEKTICIESADEAVSIIQELTPHILLLHSIVFESSFVYSIPLGVKIIWHSWGWDIYADKYFDFLSKRPVKINLYKKNTRILLLTQFAFLSLKRFFAPLIRKQFNYESFFKRIDFFSCILSIEKELLNHKLIKDLNYIQLKYLDKKLLKNSSINMNFEKLGTNILVGNSASFENNHIDLFILLKNIKGLNSKIIVPLSYGIKEYRIILNKKGMHFFGDNYYPLDSFLSVDEYDEILNTCSYALFGHLRQQAIGNIITCIQKGIKIFLSEKGVMYSYFKEMGCSVYSLESDLSIENLTTPLDLYQVKQNKMIINDKYINPYRPDCINNIIKKLV